MECNFSYIKKTPKKEKVSSCIECLFSIVSNRYVKASCLLLQSLCDNDNDNEKNLVIY